MSASMVFRKEQQSKEKANPPGSSKILSKARKKAAESKKVSCSVTSLWTIFVKRNYTYVEETTTDNYYSS